MKECMGTDKPLVSIVMATYNPRMDWFIKQLKSLNAQDYNNLELIVLDDCSTKITIEELDKCFKEQITNFPYKLYRNEKNLGSTKTFEKLTEMAAGKYISYCDQDDIWESFKISDSVQTLEKNQAILVCSDVTVIDGDDKVTSSSITEIRKRMVFRSGEGLARHLLFRNFVTGCTVLMETVIAQQAIPFIDGMIHDHWIALFASVKGKIVVCDNKVMRYRIHGNNQTSVLAGIKTKRDYYDMRILPYYQQINAISGRIKIDDILPQTLEWAKARVDYYNGEFSSIKTIFKYRNLNKTTSMFEIALKFMPKFIFNKVLNALQKGVI